LYMFNHYVMVRLTQSPFRLEDILRTAFLVLFAAAIPATMHAQSLWGGHAHDPQHTALSGTAAQSLSNIHWQTPIDLSGAAGGGGSLFVHYGSPVVTAANTVIVPVTNSSGHYQLDAFNGATGSQIYTLSSCIASGCYTPPSLGWTPPYGPALSLGTRLYYPGPGGTIFYRTSPDSATGTIGQIAFYGNALYNNNQAAFNNTVQISTPLTADRSGNIFFGFQVTGANPAGLVNGIARVSIAGTGTYKSAVSLTGDSFANYIAFNCAPALSLNQTVVYVATSTGATLGTGYLTSINAATLAPLGKVQLYDPRGSPYGLATVAAISSAVPMVGPDGDVYYGVLEDINTCCSSHNDRGWMLHFRPNANSTVFTLETPGSFGWDNTASVVPASSVPSYTGTSSYLIVTKYNNYWGTGTGDGVNKVAVLDPNGAMQDEYSTSPVTVMSEVITVTGVTPDPHTGFPNAVREWCINTIAVDPFTKAAIVNSEDGTVYRWDFTSNTLSQSHFLTSGRGEAYTPTVIGADGAVYAINDAILFSVGN
jgi:hypothetical protein